MLLHLELGDAITQQPTDAVCFFVDHYGVTHAAQLLSRSQSCGPRTHNRHLFPGADFGRLGPDPAFQKPALHDIFLDLLDRDRRLVDPQHTRRFARRWTNPPREFREVVGRVQLAHRFFPASVVHEVVPIRNQVVDGTSCLAKRNAAVHAARTLGSKILFRKILIDLEPIVDALSNWTSRGKFARVVEETIVTRAKDFEDWFVAEPPDKLRRLPQYYAAQRGLGAFPPVRCNAPWASAVVEADGAVRPCYFHRAVGNVRERSLREILANEMVAFRRGLKVAQDPTCRRCVCSLQVGLRTAL